MDFSRSWDQPFSPEEHDAPQSPISSNHVSESIHQYQKLKRKSHVLEHVLFILYKFILMANVQTSSIFQFYPFSPLQFEHTLPLPRSRSNLISSVVQM